MTKEEIKVQREKREKIMNDIENFLKEGDYSYGDVLTALRWLVSRYEITEKVYMNTVSFRVIAEMPM